MYTLQALGIYVAALVLLFLLRRVLGLFWSSLAFLIVSTVWVKIGFQPAVPQSVVVLYVGTAIIALGLYVTSSDESRHEFLKPIIAVMTQKNLTIPLMLLLLAIPTAAGWGTYQAALPSATAPPKIRSVHPSPPNSMNVQAMGMEFAATFDIIKDDNPLRPLAETDPELFQEKVALGKVIYYQNCYYCHGDYMAADGHYANAVKPPPANFQDPGTIAMLEEAFIYWRIAKGGPGLPDAGTPWDSSMPAWEKMLTEDEMWAVSLFLYDYTGYKPRKKENLAEAH